MSKEFQLEMYKKDVLKQYKRKGLDSIGEFSALYNIPLIDAYTIIKNNVNDFDIQEECEFKINRLNMFYSNRL